MNDPARLARLATTHRRILEDTRRETGWSLALCEARGLSPSEAGVVRSVAEGEVLTPDQREWLTQVALWGLVKEGESGWVLTDWGEEVNPLLYERSE